MRNFVIRVFVNALALSAAAWLVPGISLDADFGGVLLVALIFGLVNAVLKPILVILSLPFILLTLGLFALVVNAVLLLLTDALMGQLEVSGFLAALVGSLVISLVTLLLGGALKDD